MTVVVVGLPRQIDTLQLQLNSENTASGLIRTRKIIRRRLPRKCHTHISGQYELHWIMSKATWHGTSVISFRFRPTSIFSVLLLCLRHISRFYSLYRFYRGGRWTYRLSHFVLIGQNFRWLKKILAHNREGVLAGKVFSKVLFYEDRTLSVANFGAELRFFHVWSLYTVLFHNQRLASKEKCVMTDFVRRVLKIIFVVLFVKLKFCFVFVFEVWVCFLVA